MVSGCVWNTGGEKMPHSQEWSKYGNRPCDASPLPAAPASNKSGPNLPTSALTGVSVVETFDHLVNTKQISASPKGSKAQKEKSDKRYLGVRVRMPVKDMLRNFRIAKGMDPKELQKENNGSKGEKKRVHTSSDRRNRLKKWQKKSLEELAIIVEVLEEDLKTSASLKHPSELLEVTLCPEQRDMSWCKRGSYHGLMDESPPIQSYPTQPTGSFSCLPCSDYSQTNTPLSDDQGIYSSFKSVYFGGQLESICSPDESEYQMPSPEDTTSFSPSTKHLWGSSEAADFPRYSCSAQEKWNSMDFFWSQIEKQESILRGIPDQQLLAVDKYHKTMLHRAVEEGKRAFVCVIAKRMASLKELDAKDAEGKTPLHLAVQRNHHLIAADLISLGANINERDRYGKTCLHLSAEYGYVRVLEVLKSCMKNGLYVDLEARDMNGLSALQLVSISLKSSVCELERSVTEGQTRLHSLRKEQMMETLECLLQMESQNPRGMGRSNALADLNSYY